MKKTILDSACPMDCPDHCSLTVEIQDGRVARLGGSRRNPVTAGFICSKIRHFADHLLAPERIRTPLVRIDGGKKGEAAFRETSWEEALDLVEARMRAVIERHGGEAILPFHYGGSNGLLSEGAADRALFDRLGATRIHDTLCAAPTTTAMRALYGKMPSVAYDDFVHADLIVVWGANPHASHIHLVPYLKEAQRRGARLIVVDPRRTKAAKAADLHLAVRPGTDLALALAVARELFESGRADRAFLEEWSVGAEEFERRASMWSIERAASECGLDPGDIARFIDAYAEAETALIRCGWGLERNRNGGSAAAAILALPAVAGKFGRRGGGYALSSSSATAVRHRFAVEDSGARTINMNRLGRALVEFDAPPIELLFVYNANPLATVTRQEAVRRGLERDDLFTVVHEQVMTDTARYADVVLPATTFLEHHELSVGYGSISLQYAPPAIAPVGEARPNYELFAELGRRFGVIEEDASVPAMVERALDADQIRAINADSIAFPTDGAHPVQFLDTFPRTSDRKVHLAGPDIDALTPDGLYRFRDDPATEAYPLAMISPATQRTISSSLGELHRELVPVGIHPEDAHVRGIEDGTPVRIHNELGEVRTLARLDPDLRPGVVFLPKGLWSHNTQSGTTANSLCPDDEADLGLGACFNDARVEVEAC